MKGMTAYGLAKAQDDSYQISVEISSVNKRNLDIHVRLPKELQHEEVMVRKEVGAFVRRGHITVQITLNRMAAEKIAPPINWAWVDGQKKIVSQIAERFGVSVPAERLVLSLWKESSCYLDAREEMMVDVHPLLVEALQKAFEIFNTHRAREGKMLAEDFSKRSSSLYEAWKTISALSKGNVEYIQNRLKKLVAEHVPNLATDDRVYREVVLYADKADVSEELSRIDHHLGHLQRAIEGEETSGKLIEFLLQELLREFNTLGSKTPHTEVSTAVVLSKTEIEKMREQVANVE